MIPEGWLENLEDLLVEALSVPALIPEPTAGLLFTTGLVGLFWRRERREG